ncbi:hypothetical protein [Roseibium aggregatum]|uniref:hypothetical protein n=1 Tax=Roseibium aggregatum TaxID=187304 RepID=UPI001E403EEC|nr:hypothetical protein [Roseibium aggregatum]UES38312.1 hypothetical protein GFC08_10830 [Roseibium aggregatum]
MKTTSTSRILQRLSARLRLSTAICAFSLLFALPQMAGAATYAVVESFDDGTGHSLLLNGVSNSELFELGLIGAWSGTTGGAGGATGVGTGGTGGDGETGGVGISGDAGGDRGPRGVGYLGGSDGQYTGFENLSKSGASTWTVSNTPGSTINALTVSGGTLLLDGATVSSTVTFQISFSHLLNRAEVPTTRNNSWAA